MEAVEGDEGPALAPPPQPDKSKESETRRQMAVQFRSVHIEWHIPYNWRLFDGNHSGRVACSRWERWHDLFQLYRLTDRAFRTNVGLHRKGGGRMTSSDCSGKCIRPGEVAET